jgi:hypothetical protein
MWILIWRLQWQTAKLLKFNSREMLAGIDRMQAHWPLHNFCQIVSQPLQPNSSKKGVIC